MNYPKIDFLYLSEDDMLKARVDDVVGCTNTMEEMLKLLDKGDYRMGGENGNSHGCMINFPDEPEFQNMPKNAPDRRFMAMPAYLGGKFDLAGMKWYGSNVENRLKGLPRSILMVMLNDKDTGAPLALMSANLISAYRTAAVPGAGVKNLAVKNAKVLGIYGPGVINMASIETFAALRPTLDTVKIKGRSTGSIDKFIEHVKTKCPQFKTIEVVDSIEDLVKDCDICSFASSMAMGAGPDAYPHIQKEWVKPGALFCLPGAGDFSDDFIKSDNVKLVVDNIKLYEAWAEEYEYPVYNLIYLLGSKLMDMYHDGKLSKERIHDLGAILNDKLPGRENDEQIILYSIGGMPVEDVAWGKEVYDYAIAHGIGTKLNLWDKPSLF